MSKGPIDLGSERKRRAWRDGLQLTKDKEPRRTLGNALHILVTHPEWKDVLAWDEFGQCVVARQVPPMREQDAPPGYQPGDWLDEDSSRSMAWFGSEVGFEPGPQIMDAAIQAAARRNVVHPVRDWLLGLEWDGELRLDDFVHRHLGGAQGAYSAAVGRRWLIAAVARVFSPGCKVDSMLVLEGIQGIGKSSALRFLAGNEWFADTGLDIGNKDSFQSLRRKWIYEFGELASVRGREIERVKSFLSSQKDTYRPSYGRRTMDFPRQIVFAGSTNDSEYLADPTGARRFWPVRCSAIDLAAIERDREQLWAEATAAYSIGEPWHLDTPELRELAAQEAAERAEEDPWDHIVLQWLSQPITRARAQDGFTTSDVLAGAIEVPSERMHRQAQMRIGQVLRRLGFERRRVRIGMERHWKYFPVPTCDGSEEGRDTGGDNVAAEKGSCPYVPTCTRDFITHKEGGTGEEGGFPKFREVGGDSGDVGTEAKKGSKNVPTSVPTLRGGSDRGVDDIEREAIQAEGSGEVF